MNITRTEKVLWPIVLLVGIVGGWFTAAYLMKGG